ncbi:MAG TPA: di-heme oxidoredictase family protein [Rhizomicrobium sp.]
MNGVLAALAIVAALSAVSTAVAGAPDIAAGKALFERQWVAAPSPTHDDEGLGPLYDARSCDACHTGTGPGVVAGGIGAGLLVRLGNSTGGADPVYGAQLQTKALPGIAPEAAVAIVWGIHDGRRTASLHISSLGYGALDSHSYAALRRAPSLAGAAALAAVGDAEILAGAAREHRAGMAGHAAILTDEGQTRLGRFGWKAANPDLAAQIAVALQRDIGLSSARYPAPWGECTNAQAACRELALRSEGAKIEVPDSLRDELVAYVASLPAPVAPDERAPGAAIFSHIGCGDCHAALHAPDGHDIGALTDLLLHDLGPQLDDGIAEGAAKASEWRTAPLWNLADELAAGGLLHDGRARSIAEAVRWHGGEASPARRRFEALGAPERLALERFLLRK